ncbi:MAG: hypothetical protein K2I13_02895 [Alistipes sp.]|nr:hypothetical protein [Alistipes sp.]
MTDVSKREEKRRNEENPTQPEITLLCTAVVASDSEKSAQNDDTRKQAEAEDETKIRRRNALVKNEV